MSVVTPPTGLRSPIPRFVLAFWRALRPVAQPVDGRERLRVVSGALLGIGITALLCHLIGVDSRTTWIVAPMGASAVLAFGVPASPLAQPWAVLAGNTFSALVGIACARWLAPIDVDLAAGAAVALAIGLMFTLRCLHPPGGASALMMVLGGVTDWHVALQPVLLNSVILVLLAVAWNNLTGRRYPHAQAAAPARSNVVGEDELENVLSRYNQVLDMPRDDLQTLLGQLRLQDWQHMLARTRCGDVMSRDVLTVSFGTPMQEAWKLLRTRGVKALPVVDRVQRVVGILTLADFLATADLDLFDGFQHRLKKLIRPTPTVHSDKPEVVGQIMTRRVLVASQHKPLVDLVPVFARSGHHHIPIVDNEQRLVGILTQSDLVAAVFRAQRTAE